MSFLRCMSSSSALVNPHFDNLLVNIRFLQFFSATASPFNIAMIKGQSSFLTNKSNHSWRPCKERRYFDLRSVNKDVMSVFNENSEMGSEVVFVEKDARDVSPIKKWGRAPVKDEGWKWRRKVKGEEEKGLDEEASEVIEEKFTSSAQPFTDNLVGLSDVMVHKMHCEIRNDVRLVSTRCR